MKIKLRLVAITTLMQTLILVGCASTIETLDGKLLRIGSPEFRSYALDVFKRNNSTLTVLFDAIEQADDENALRLELAEESVVEACETLNSAAAARRDGKQLGAGILRTISSTIRPCDAATNEADRLIMEVSSVSLPPVSGDESVL